MYGREIRILDREIVEMALPALSEDMIQVEAVEFCSAMLPSIRFSPIAQIFRHRSRHRILAGSANGLSRFSAIRRPSSRAADS